MPKKLQVTVLHLFVVVPAKTFLTAIQTVCMVKIRMGLLIELPRHYTPVSKFFCLC